MSIIEKALGKRETPKAEDQPSTARSRPHQHPTPAASTAAPTQSEQAQSPSPAPASAHVEVDLQDLRRQGIWPSANMERQVRDEFRRIKRPLLKNARGLGAGETERGNLVLVTSSVAGEGKTFSAINLALSMSQEPDCAVLLVDGDVARRNTSELLGIAERRGLVDLLADQSLRPEDVVVSTNVGSLSLIPAGKPHALTSELLASTRMENVIARLAAPGARQIVVFDSPPLLASPEAVSLAAVVGQVAMVVKAEGTKRHEVLAALDQVEPNKPINMVLNQSRRRHGENYYGGYYGDNGAE